MNSKISGAKMVFVPIHQTGANYFPFVEDLKNRYVKFIDFHPAQYLPDTAVTGVDGSFPLGTFYVTLANEIGNKFLFNRLPLENLNYQKTQGVRLPIGAKLSLQNCYIECNDKSYIGQTVALIFYYDLPQYSERNTTKQLMVDRLSVPITTATFRNLFPDSLRMSGKRFRNVLFTPTTTTPEYQPGVTQNWEYLYITLRKGSYNVIENLPLSVILQYDKLEKLVFANIIFDFQSSFITVGGAGALAGQFVGKSAFLNLTYEM